MGLLALLALPQPGRAALLFGRVADADSGTPLAGVSISLHPLAGPAGQQTVTDSAGRYSAELEAGEWALEARQLGYAPARRRVLVGGDAARLDLRLVPQPLQMDAMVVRARRPGSSSPVPAFVEEIALEGAGHLQAGAGLPEVLEQAAGVSIRRQGGLGSFSTLSIRGSTAEQVQIYLDGVPLNQATGGGVDVGALPVGGLESIEIYRGAVPARFGGNSIGGVVHIRTSQASGQRQVRLHGGSGSFGTRRAGVSVSDARGPWRLLTLVDYQGSDNGFRFWDDNGTEYNPADDEWALRRNADFRSLRGLAKVRRLWAGGTVEAHTSLDLSHRGIPGIGNFQSLHTRFDTWRSTTEVEIYGALAPLAAAGYRLTAYHLLQEDEFSDLQDEVGAGTQHDLNRTHSIGTRAEINALAPGFGVVTAFAGYRRERFDPDNLLEPASLLFDSRRRGYSGGAEAEVPLWGGRLQASAGAQVEVLDDRFWDQEIIAAAKPSRDHVERLWGHRLGLRLDLGRGWVLQGHRGRYQRAPNFYELFGDRGAVAGNVDLDSESGRNWDAGVVYRPQDAAPAGVHHLEMAWYDHRTEDLIRFIQNSQRVSRPQNIGRARVRGLETRAQVQLPGRLAMSGNYVYQRPENRSPYAWERGNDLPNAPRHRANLRIVSTADRASLYWEVSRESRHWLDRANLRPVPRRTVHGIGGAVQLPGGVEAAWEVRNLTDNQVADLWGYPLPGRAAFASLKYQLDLSTEAHTSKGAER